MARFAILIGLNAVAVLLLVPEAIDQPSCIMHAIGQKRFDGSDPRTCPDVSVGAVMQSAKWRARRLARRL